MKSDTDTAEMAKFTKFMRRILAVSHDELKAKMDAYEQNKKRRKARRASRASNGQG